MPFISNNLSGTPTSSVPPKNPELHASYTDIHLASEKLIKTYLKKTLENLETLEESDLLEKFKELRKDLSNNISTKSDDTSENFNSDKNKINVDDYINRTKLSLMYINFELFQKIEITSEETNSLYQIKSINRIFENQITNVINQVQEKTEELIKEINILLKNPYQHPCFLTKRWITWVLTALAAVINSVLTYLCGIHIIFLSPEIYSTINAVLTILPRAIQERFNLHDLNGAYKEKEWKDNEAKLNTLKKSLESISKKFRTISKEINNYHLIKLMQHALHQALLEQTYKDQRVVELTSSMSSHHSSKNLFHSLISHA